ncbi:MAG: septum formation protein Maf [Brachymonas sp.]|nr:septum formation protein Maf [Brachymonas sp.]
MSTMIYLASQSPRRAQLLEQLGVKFQLLVADDAEDAESLEAVMNNEAPSKYVQRVTGLEAGCGFAANENSRFESCASALLGYDGRSGRKIYGKPESERDAVRMLGELQGRTHRVLTAVALQSGKKRLQALSVSQVTFAPMTPQQIKAYVASGEPMGKAGAYAIQGKAAAYISRISGSHSGIMGLPMHETAQLLSQLKILLILFAVTQNFLGFRVTV